MIFKKTQESNRERDKDTNIRYKDKKKQYIYTQRTIKKIGHRRTQEKEKRAASRLIKVNFTTT
jgi:hypothetical protein